MTKFTKERLEQYIKSPLEHGLTRSEQMEMSRQLLAGMEQEPVGEVVLGDYDDCGDYPDAKVVCIAAQGQADWNNFRNGTRLYAAPQLPQPAVGDGRAEFEAWMLKKWGRERQEYDFVMGKFQHGDNYADSYTRHMWKAWLASRAAMLQGAEPVSQHPDLTVWYGSMPETNGKSNWTAILHRKGEGIQDGITIDRSEYPGRVLYAADRVRYLIGEKPDRPYILDYDGDKHSGYVKPVSQSDELPKDYQQGHKDGLEWSARLAEANHPQTGDWLYDDPLELAKAIRKGPDMPTAPVQGWIPCSERMPDETQPVIVVSDGGVVQRAVYQFCEGVWIDWYEQYDEVSADAFTHWMPLPAAPQQ